MADDNTHTFFYKILEQQPPSPLPETLPSTALDAQDGFIHLSTAAQTPVTASLYFAKYPALWLLKVRVKDLDGSIEYAAESGRGCPHLHGSRVGLGQSNVEEVIELQKGPANDWKQVERLVNLED